MEARWVDGIERLGQAEWDALVAAEPPFWEWAYLAACERHSATPEAGIWPRHLVLSDEAGLAGALLGYVKADGRGEFVYDYAWAHRAMVSGLAYYPKLVSMAPFAPATGRHLLVRPDLPWEPIATALVEQAERAARAMGLTGIHLLFTTPRESALLDALGYARRHTFQLALPARYGQFDDYLAAFRSKDRISVKRDLRIVADAGIAIERCEGDQLGEAERDDMYRYYRLTCDGFGTGSDYLQEDTWRDLWDGWRHRLLVTFARHEGRRVAGALCAHKSGVLYGRYWGASGHWPSLYYVLAYYEPLRWLLERGGEQFFAGFGNAPGKRDRGFDPVQVLSAHKAFDPRLHALIAGYAADERERVDEAVDALQARSKRRPP